MIRRTTLRLLLTALYLSLALPAAAGAGAVALQGADPSCRDTSASIYVDCGNGTVTDNRTGLVWLKNANCFGLMDWHEAVEVVAGLSDLPQGLQLHDCGLRDGSSPGEWRLPSAGEWKEMMKDAVELGCVFGFGPAITNDSGSHCWGNGVGQISFLSIQNSWYWSATSWAFDPADYTLWASLGDGGYDDFVPKAGGNAYVWPVRGGQ